MRSVSPVGAPSGPRPIGRRPTLAPMSPLPGLRILQKEGFNPTACAVGRPIGNSHQRHQGPTASPVTRRLVKAPSRDTLCRRGDRGGQGAQAGA